MTYTFDRILFARVFAWWGKQHAYRLHFKVERWKR